MCVQKSKYVMFSSAFSSSYAKTRTSNFRKVMRQHTEGMVRSIIWLLLEIYLASQQWKKFENPLRINTVIAMSFMYYFFGTQCRMTALPYAELSHSIQYQNVRRTELRHQYCASIKKPHQVNVANCGTCSTNTSMLVDVGNRTAKILDADWLLGYTWSDLDCISVKENSKTADITCMHTRGGSIYQKYCRYITDINTSISVYHIGTLDIGF